MEEEILALAVIAGIGMVSIALLLYLDATGPKSAPSDQRGRAIKTEYDAVISTPQPARPSLDKRSRAAVLTES